MDREGRQVQALAAPVQVVAFISKASLVNYASRRRPHRRVGCRADAWARGGTDLIEHHDNTAAHGEHE